MWITQNPPQTIKLDDAIHACIIKYEYVDREKEKEKTISAGWTVESGQQGQCREKGRINFCF